MASIRTPLTEHLGLKTPIISAPMGFAASPELAAAVTSGGGFGTLSACQLDHIQRRYWAFPVSDDRDPTTCPRQTLPR
ncbi:hypothetical protein C8F01DRAFT_1165964 [Mycena amicta]|nr:hypothetical protein C8F01DRAFT_1165964 [Mycena amicta]